MLDERSVLSEAKIIEAEFGVTPPLFSPAISSTVKMNFLEGVRNLPEEVLRSHDITQHHVTRFYSDHIRRSGFYNQLKYIVEPSLMEFSSPGSLDTSGEHQNTVVTGLQHKYAQTGLLLVTDRCASYCRYCFRKRIVGNDSDEIIPDYAQVAEYIMQHPEMTNVLLSGGDPFVLSTRKLNRILDYLLPIPHLRSIRFGTKTVAFAPKRFEDAELPPMFRRIHEAGKTAVVVAHFDHLGEISEEAESSIRRMRAEGVQFLNQAVLLAKVNDDPEILAATFAKCHEIGVRPYYLFQGRPVKGASHFQVPLRRGVRVVEAVNQRLSGIQKTFKYIMSHYTGKIEILGFGEDDRLYMRYHQSNRPERIGKVFSRHCSDDACWFDELHQRVATTGA
jgi:KamA family protein